MTTPPPTVRAKCEAVSKITPVKAWGVVTSTGRLRNYATRYRRQQEADKCFGDTIVPVLIVPVGAKP